MCMFVGNILTRYIQHFSIHTHTNMQVRFPDGIIVCHSIMFEDTRYGMHVLVCTGMYHYVPVHTKTTIIIQSVWILDVACNGK